jgi:hypothetical protein
MKKRRILLPMIFCAVLHGMSFANQSALEERIQAQDEKSTNATQLNGNEANQAGSEKDLTGGHFGQSQRNSAVRTTSLIKYRSATAHAKPAIHPVRSGSALPNENFRAPDTLDFHQANSIVSPGIPNKTSIHRSTPVASSTAALPAVALDGQQFKNPRKPGARMASSGGQVNSSRATAGINGSEVKRKP